MRKELQVALDWERANRPVKFLSAADIMQMTDAEMHTRVETPNWAGGTITWDELVQIEPDLKYLLRTASNIRRPAKTPWCSNNIWYGLFKPRLLQLVGWECERPNPALRSTEAYDVAYETIYHALPPCRDCHCA